jgi:hypothetical protein
MSMKHHSRHEAPAMHHESESDDESPLARQQSMLAINKCRYNVPVQSSIFSDRQQVTYSFNPNNYANVSPSTVAQIIFNSGSAFLNGPGCSIVFGIQVSNNGMSLDQYNSLTYQFGSNSTIKSGGSATNVFSEVSITARAGDQLERIEKANAFWASVKPFRKGDGATYMDSAQGGASLSTAGTDGVPTYQYPRYWASNTNYFEVPLASLFNFFGQAAPIPGVLASGLRMNLIFENFLNALYFQYTMTAPDGSRVNPGNGSPPPANYTYANVPVLDTLSVNMNVVGMQLVLDQYTAYDSANSVILGQAQSLSSSGLQYSYLFNYHNRVTLSGASETLQVNVSAAKLKTICLRFRKPEANSGRVDSMASLPLVNYGGITGAGTSIFFNGTADGTNVGNLGTNGSIRVRVGSSLLELLPVRSASQLYRFTVGSLCNIKSGLSDDLNVLGDSNRVMDINASYTDWALGTGLSAGCTTVALDFERNALLGISGASSNNSRSISLELFGLNAGPGAANVILDIWIQHLVVANTTTENVILDK